MFETGLALIAIVLILLMVNLLQAQENPRYNTLFDRLLLAIHLMMALAGAVILFSPSATGMEMTAAQGQLFGFSFLAMGTWGMLVSLTAVRQQIARHIPFRADAPVHTLALLFTGYLVANTAMTLSQGGLEALAEVTTAATIWDVIANQMIFILTAVFGVGFLIRRKTMGELFQRLGIEPISRRQVGVVFRWIMILIVLQWIGGALTVFLDPEGYELLDGVSGALLGDIDTVWEWAILAMATGLGEEMLFRGALQPVFGLTATAVLFAVVHIQYGFTIITILVFLMGIALGYLRQKENLTTTIFVHAGYNFSLGLLSMLAVALEPFANG